MKNKDQKIDNMGYYENFNLLPVVTTFAPHVSVFLDFPQLSFLSAAFPCVARYTREAMCPTAAASKCTDGCLRFPQQK